MIIKKSLHGAVFSMAMRAKGEFFQPLGQPVWYVLGSPARWHGRVICMTGMTFVFYLKRLWISLAPLFWLRAFHLKCT